MDRINKVILISQWKITCKINTKNNVIFYLFKVFIVNFHCKFLVTRNFQLNHKKWENTQICYCLLSRNADKRRPHDGKDINGSQHVKLVVGAKCGLYERDLRRTTGRPRGMGTVRVAVTMMDQINEHFHSDSVSNINTIVYHSRVTPATFISISFCNIEDHHFQIKFIKKNEAQKSFLSIWERIKFSKIKSLFLLVNVDRTFFKKYITLWKHYLYLLIWIYKNSWNFRKKILIIRN